MCWAVGAGSVLGSQNDLLGMKGPTEVVLTLAGFTPLAHGNYYKRTGLEAGEPFWGPALLSTAFSRPILGPTFSLYEVEVRRGFSKSSASKDSK